MVTISDGSTTRQAAMEAIQYTHAARNVIHEVLGRTDPDVVFRPASTRAGTLILRCATFPAAVALAEAHAAAQVLTLTDPDNPTNDMSYVVTNDIQVMHESVGRVAGFVHVPFREVLA